MPNDTYGLFVGKSVLDKETGLIFSFIIAISPELIYQSKNLYQPFFLPFFSLLFLLVITNNKNYLRTRIIIAIFTLFIPLHIHFGAMLMLPIGLSWLCWFSLVKHKKDLNIKDLFVFGFLMFIMSINFVFATFTKFPFD